MKLAKYLMISFTLLTLVVTGCKNDGIEESSFENKIYISSNKQETLLIKAGNSTITKTIQAALPKPLEYDLTIRYDVDLSKVEEYNLMYNDRALLLPEANYVFTTPEAEFSAGSVRSTNAVIDFVDVDKLDRELRYVLPVRIVDTGGCSLLERSSTIYYVFKGAALINTVGDMEKNYCTVTWKKIPNSLTTLTFEALLRARYINRSGSDSEILTIMGIEQYFLLRVGDKLFPGQIQFTNPDEGFPEKDITKVLPTNQWVHVALTFDNGYVKIYVDGKLQSEGKLKKMTSVNLRTTGGGDGMGGFHLGASYNQNRWWPGEMCEVRVWSVARTQEEIASNIYYVAPDSEGLEAYWKFDEGEGDIIHDRTGNGNDAVVQMPPMVWTPVELPATEE